MKIEDFISSAIIKRLDMEYSISKTRITGWRGLVDCVMIDAAHDGKLFNMAVKIIDMLGEEELVVAEV